MPAIGEILNMKFNKASKTQTLSGSNTTVATPLFRVTGTVRIGQLYAIVTTALGSNVTAAHWRLNDQTAQWAITASAGTTMSSLPVGSLAIRLTVATSALTVKSSATGGVQDLVAATAPDVFMPTVLIQKTAGVNTDIEFVYTTTNTPTSGVIQHFVEWQPLSEGSTLTVL